MIWISLYYSILGYEKHKNLSANPKPTPTEPNGDEEIGKEEEFQELKEFITKLYEQQKKKSD